METCFHMFVSLVWEVCQQGKTSFLLQAVVASDFMSKPTVHVLTFCGEETKYINLPLLNGPKYNTLNIRLILSKTSVKPFK